MNLEKIKIARRLASLALAAALAFGGLQGLASHDLNDAPPEEVAGGTWSLKSIPTGKGGGADTNAATWS